MTLTVHAAGQIRRAVHFTDLIEPMRAAFRDYSAGRAQQTMSTLWPAVSQEDGDVLVKAGCIAGHDIFVVKIAPWFNSNELAGQAQGGLVAAFSSKNGHPLAVFADEHYLSDARTAAAGAIAAGTLARHERPRRRNQRDLHPARLVDVAAALAAMAGEPDPRRAG